EIGVLGLPLGCGDGGHSDPLTSSYLQVRRYRPDVTLSSRTHKETAPADHRGCSWGRAGQAAGACCLAASAAACSSPRARLLISFAREAADPLPARCRTCPRSMVPAT